MRFRRRLIFLYVVFCAAMGIVWLRATQLQWFDGDAWAEAAQAMRRRTEPLAALRGPIVSADGVVLAEDAPVFQLSVVAWDWQRRERVRCSGCGAIYHARGRPRSDGTLQLSFPRTCACEGRTSAATASDAYPRRAQDEAKPLLERLPPADLAPLERALDVSPGTIAKLAKARIAKVTEIVRKARLRMDAEGDDTAFRDKRLEMMEQDLLMRPYVIIGRMSEEAAQLVLTDESGAYEGLEVRSALRRHYPLGDFAPQLLGFTSQLDEHEYEPLHAQYGSRVTYNTRIGRKGLERAHNWDMHGTPGYRVVELDESGQWSKIIEDVPPRPGEPLLLSLDARTTRLAEELLFKDKWRSGEGYVPGGRPSGAFVAIDAYTGEVLIWAEGPRFDLNEDLDDLYDKRLVEVEADLKNGTWLPRHPLEAPMTLEEWRARLVLPAPLGMSRVSQVAIEPGSTMKPFMALGMLASGLPLPLERYECVRGHHMPGCHGCGVVWLETAIVHSCNRYFAYSVRDSKYWPTYRTFLGGFVADLGLGSAPGSEVPEWAAGQWLWPWVDFTLPVLLERVRGELREKLGGKAPELQLGALAAAPETLGGDPERLAKRLTDVAAWVAQQTGSRRLRISAERVATIERQMDVRFGVSSADRKTWFELPGTDTRRLPPSLVRLAPDRAGIRGHLERGGTVWFTVTMERKVGRDDPSLPPVIRPEDGRNVAIGQGPVLVTPLQMARAVAVFANGGLLVEPHVARAVGRHPVKSGVRRLNLDPRQIDRVREGMYGVVNLPEGTAFKHPHWDRVPATVYGKTGTSQVGSSWNPLGRVDDEGDGPWHHWFVGFAEAPGRRTIAFACVLHARLEPAAGMTAAPATAEILSHWYQSDLSRGEK